MSEELLEGNPQAALNAERLSKAEKGQVWHQDPSLFSFCFITNKNQTNKNAC